MFLDQGELDDQKVTNELPEPLAPPVAPEAAPSGKSLRKNQKLLLVVLLVIVLLGLGYVLLGLNKTAAPKVSQVPVSAVPTVPKSTSTTLPQNLSYKVTKNPFVPVGSPGVNISNTPAPSSPTTSVTQAG